MTELDNICISIRATVAKCWIERLEEKMDNHPEHKDSFVRNFYCNYIQNERRDFGEYCERLLD